MYEVGDKFIIEIDKIYANTTNHGCEKVYRIKGFNSLVLDENGLNQLQRCNEYLFTKDDYDMAMKDGYIYGLNDMWEAITLISGLYQKDIEDIFGYKTLNDVTKYNSAEDFIKKIKDYDKQRKSKEFIKIGDEVINKDRKGIVIDTFSLPFDNKEQCVTILFGARVSSLHLKEVEKTGKHFDIPWIES